MMGNRIILSDDDIILLSDYINDKVLEIKEVEKLRKKLNSIVNIIKLEREYRDNINNINNEYFKDVEKESK